MINVETLHAILSHVKDCIDEQSPPGKISLIKILRKGGNLSTEEEIDLHHKYIGILQQIRLHCDLLLEDVDWKGNLT